MLKIFDVFHPILRMDNITFYFYPESSILDRILHKYSDLLDNNKNVDKKSIIDAGNIVNFKITSKLSRGQLQTMALKHNINIKKKSKQTGNMIFKNKQELRSDLIAVSTSI